MSNFWPAITRYIGIQSYGLTKQPRAVYLNLESVGFTDPLVPQNGFRGSLTTLKLFAKFANVFVGNGLIVFINFSRALIHFQAICFTQLDLQLTLQLYMSMIFQFWFLGTCCLQRIFFPTEIIQSLKVGKTLRSPQVGILATDWMRRDVIFTGQDQSTHKG